MKAKHISNQRDPQTPTKNPISGPATNDTQTKIPAAPICVDYSLLYMQTHRLEGIVWEFCDDADNIHGALKLLRQIIKQKPFVARS